MSIRLACPTGHTLTVPDAWAGRAGRCPVCKATVQVPLLAAAPADASAEATNGSEPTSAVSRPAEAPTAAAATASVAAESPAAPPMLRASEQPVQPSGALQVPAVRQAPRPDFIAPRIPSPPPPLVIANPSPSPPPLPALPRPIPSLPAPPPPLPVVATVATEPLTNAAHSVKSKNSDASPPPNGGKLPAPATPLASIVTSPESISRRDALPAQTTAPTILQLPADQRAQSVPATPALSPTMSVDTEEVRPRTGYQPDADKRQTAYYLAAAMAALSIYGMLPALPYANLGAAPNWARAALLLSLLQLAYAAWVASIPDWATLRASMILCTIVAALYAVTMTVALTTPLSDTLPLDLSDVRRQAVLWSAGVVLLASLLAYFCGRAAWRWRRMLELIVEREM